MRDRNYRRGFRYREGTNEYQVRVPRRNWKWLWLLLLLLLFIRCERTIEVTTIDAVTSEGIEDVNVSLSYKTHYLFKDGFFTSEDIDLSIQTDDSGKAVFEKLPCSVFSYIFYSLSKVHISANSPCFHDAKADRLFHWCWSHTFKMDPILKDLVITVVDKETEEPLVDATVELKYNSAGEMVTDSLKTDANGRVRISQFWECGVFSEIRGSCYGYADTIKTEVPARDLMEIGPASTLKLRPLKLSFDFFVHNVETKEPIPMALATVTLTNPDKRTTRGTTRTNVDGKGRGFYDDAFVLATIGIEASKEHYYDSVLVGEYTVEQFVKLTREERTVWLRPKPFMVEFQNVDSISGDPIPGVTNKIIVTDPTGKVETFEEISNTNGKFSFTTKEGSKVEIISVKEEEYKTKNTLIESFEEGQKIEMSPIIINCSVDIVFCIDNTGSMMGSIASVKANAKTFYKDFSQCCLKHHRQVEQMRLKVIKFGDLSETHMEETEMLEMPEKEGYYNWFLDHIKMSGGGDAPEDGLEAIALAIKNTPWNSYKDKERTRHIIVMYTDAVPHPLRGYEYIDLSKIGGPYTPIKLPSNMEELTELWEGMDPVGRRLVLFAPKLSFWNDISSSWDGVYHREYDPFHKYDDILEAICKSL